MENINNSRIILDYDSVRDDIENVLGEINSLRSDKFFVKTMGADFAQKVKDRGVLVKKRLYDAFNIVVIGDFKRGKSTLVNALIGEDVLPSAVTPETVTINKVSFSDTPQVEAVLKNGTRAMLAYKELRRKSIEKIAEKLPADIDFIDVRSNAEILKEITIVDTPGVGDLLNAFDKKVTDYLVNADALIYMVNAKIPLSMTERAFLSTTVMPQNFARIFTVVNMADTLETAENISEMEEFTKERISAVSPSIQMYMLSALDELCRKKELKRPMPELSSLLEVNFLEFETALHNDIILQKNVIKSTRAVMLARLLIDDVANRINLLKNSLQSNIEKLISDENELKNENSTLMKSIESEKIALANGIDEMKDEAKNWMTEFLTRLESNINSIKEQANVSDLERHFQFFMSDSIKNALTACVERHQTDISDKISDITKTMANEITQNAFGNINTQIAANITDISWTKADTAMFFGTAVMMIGDVGKMLGPIQLAIQAIGGFIRQGMVSEKQTDFLGPILKEFNSIKNNVLANTDTVYENLKLSAIDKLQETFQNQIEASLETINQAKQIAQDESMRSEEVTEYFDSTLAELNGYREVLEKYN
jgi:GTPase SAR1 family protein